MKIAALLPALALPGTVQGVFYEDCGSTAYDVEIAVAGCPDSANVCLFPENKMAYLEANFTTESALTSTVLKIDGMYGPSTLRLPFAPTEACDKWGIRCPSEPWERHTLKFRTKISEAWLKVKYTAKVQLFDDKGIVLICKVFLAEIV